MWSHQTHHYAVFSFGKHFLMSGDGLITMTELCRVTPVPKTQKSVMAWTWTLRIISHFIDGGSVASWRSLSLISYCLAVSLDVCWGSGVVFSVEWVISGSKGRVRREGGEGWCWRIKAGQPSVCVSHKPRDDDVRFRRLWQAKKPHMLTFNISKATIWKHLTHLHFFPHSCFCSFGSQAMI